MASRILLATLLLVVACGNPFENCPDDARPTADIVDVTWYLRFVERPAFTDAARDPSQFTLVLGSNGWAGMDVRCNGCSASYEACGSSIRFDDEYVCTLALCLPSDRLDDYPRLLTQAKTLTREGKYLTLSSPQATLRFTRTPTE